MLIHILFATIAVSSIAFFVTLFLAHPLKKTSSLFLPLLVSFAAGILLGNAFLHLLPESFKHLPPTNALTVSLYGFIFLFVFERFLHWHHCHTANCNHHHTLAYSNLLTDFLHNFIDGVVIASAFILNIKLGILTTLSVALHEIPQEIGDVGVLFHAGLSLKKVLVFNTVIAFSAVLGGVLGFLLLSPDTSTAYLAAFTAGTFLYLAASDLIPELKKSTHRHIQVLSLTFFLSGLFLMQIL